ncbi:DUF799 domain-containing protein [Janthinobacterium lividum]|nr:DUF799 domain-containing protein [Janthinobacterium lividum]
MLVDLKTGALLWQGAAGVPNGLLYGPRSERYLAQ